MLVHLTLYPKMPAIQKDECALYSVFLKAKLQLEIRCQQITVSSPASGGYGWGSNAPLVNEPLLMLKTTALSPKKTLKAVPSSSAVYSCQCSCLQRTKLCMTLFRWTKRFETRANSGMASRATCPECYGFQLTGVPYVPLPAEIHHLSALSIFLV